MADANDMYDTIMRELTDLVICDTDEIQDEQESFSFLEQADFDDIPPSLLSYFETSKSRAAVCERLIHEETEDFTVSHHAKDTMNLPIELDKDTMKLNEQVISDTENEENNTSSDTRLVPAPTDTEALFTHNVSVCPNNEDESGTNKYMAIEKHLTLETRSLEFSLNENKRKKSSGDEAERERRLCEELKREEQKRQTERDFQEELRRIMEAEKLHQKELEIMEKRAQEKLEHEFQLQQELISNLQRRVWEERKMREEEQQRMKDEEDKRKRAEEKMKIEAERKRMEEETRKKQEEEERKIEEVKLKREAERKNEERRRMEREEKKKEEEETKKKKLEDEKRRVKEEENQKREEERKKMEGETKEVDKRETERRKLEEEMRLKKEEEWRKKEEKERKKREEENMGISEEGRVTKDTEERKKQEEMKEKKEEEADDRKKDGEMRKEDKKKHGNVVEEVKTEERKKREEVEEKEETRKREKERIVVAVVRKQEGENRNMKEELRPIEEDEKWKKEEERKTQEEEQRMKKEKMRRQKDDEDNRKSEEEMRLKEDEEEYKRYNVDNKKVEHENKTKNKENKWEEEHRKEEEESQHVYAEKKKNEEEVGENREEVNIKTDEEMRLKEKEESKKTRVQDRENVLARATEVKDKRKNNSMTDLNENMVKAENSSQLEDSTTRTSSSPGPSHCESAVRPSTEAKPQQHDRDENISQTSTDKTVDCDNQAANPSTIYVFLPMCLPEQTEQKRLLWMKDCIPWSKLSLQNRRKQKGSIWSRRGPRRTAEASSVPPLCPDSLLQSTGWKSLQEVTTVTLQDLPGCSLSTLAQCTQLRSLSIRRCGLKSLDGIKQLPKLCYIDVQENDISFVDCENMTSLQVLQLGHNKLTSIHGLAGAENLDVLDLSHNSITRIAGLESVRRLQRLSVDHNQLISIKELKDVYTLLHLNCSYNHLTSVEGLENSALLNTLDLRGNSLTELPSLNNQVLLRELHLDDNSISSLQGLAACWLPLLQHLSVAQNRITQLPSMSDSVSLSNLDLRFNCMSELQNVCESLWGCQFLQEVHLTGNPLQQESGWRSSLQKALPGLRAIDGQETDSSPSPPAVQQVSLASGSFLTFCQAQLQQTRDLQQRHSRELSNASSSLDAVKISCRHFTEALQLATDQRFAHEYGDTTVANKHRAPRQKAKLEEVLDMDGTTIEKRTENPVMESTGKVPPVFPNEDDIRCSYWTFDEKSAAESRRDTYDTVTTGPKMGPTISTANSSSGLSLAIETKTISSNLEMAPVSNHLDLDLQSTAAIVIQQQWRKYRQKCGNISSPSTAEKGGGRGGDGRKPESGPSNINGSVAGQDYAATVIQAFWRGCTLRRRLASALAAVTCPDSGEDDTFEEVDVDEFVFDEAELEKQWRLPLSEDSPPRHYPVSEQSLPLKVKPPGLCPEPSQYILPPPLVRRSKQAWVAAEQVDSAGQRVSPVSPRCESPASVISGLSESSEKILEEWGFTSSRTALLMLKRAQKMKSKKQQQKKRQDPSIHLALFRNCSYQLGQVKARNRQTQHNRNHIKVGEAELGLQRAEKTERVKQERAQQWLHTQTAHSDGDSKSAHFLPEISSDILNGGRVQLVADARYTDRLHHASGLWANSSLASQPCKENNYPRRNSWSHAREKVPSPQRVTSVPSKKERISFRDNPVQLSGGWGGGKKRDKVYK